MVDRGQIDLETVLQLGLVMVIGAVFIATIVTLGASVQSGTATIEDPTTNFTTVDSRINEIPGDVDVMATTETALFFDGSAYVESSAPGDVGESWTLCSTGELGDDANQNATYSLAAYENESIHLQYDAGQWAVYHDNGSHDGRAAISATADDLTPVCARYDAGSNDLSIEDTDSNATAQLTSSTTSRNVSWEWIGRIDETRVFNESIDDANVTAYLDDPVQPLPGTNRAARFMFDEGSGSSTTVYFAGVDATLVGTAWTDGVENPSTSTLFGTTSAIQEGDDYELDDSPFSIRLVEDGYLDGAPVIHIEWSGSGWIPINATGLLALFAALVVMMAFVGEIRKRM